MVKMKQSNIKNNLMLREKELIDLANIAWNKTLKEYYYPPLNPPNFVFDYTHKEGFYIDPDHKWQITMNLANIPLFTDPKEYVNYFHAISLHEVSHYQIIPYDGLINARLLKAAMKHVNVNLAPIIVNIFADLIIDTKLYKKYPELIYWELKTTYNYIHTKYKDKISEFSEFLFRTYEFILNIEMSESNNNAAINNLAKKVADIVLKKFEDDTLWGKKVEKIAYILKELISTTFKLKKSGKVIDCPKDILEIMDNPLESKNIDKMKEKDKNELRKKAEEFARETPYSEFGAPASQSGLLIDKNPLSTWYRGLAKNLIEIRIFETKPGGKMPIYPEPWRIGEPIELLDVVQTILTSPVIIPNITTRKWSKKEDIGILIEKQIPDLLLVIDSSGSMNWNYTEKVPKGQYHTALIASFAALHYAASKGVKFSIINFSNRADICDWTKNYHDAEKILLRYQGGGTQLPVDAILKQCEKAERNVLTLIITDFGIYNWGSAKKTLLELSEKGNKVVGFFIGSSKIPKNRFKDLLDKVSFYAIKNEKILINLVIEEIKKHYS